MMDLDSKQSDAQRKILRGWIEVAVAIAIVLILPIAVAVQSGEANEPWDEPWIGGWPATLEHDTAAADPGIVMLRQRAAASLERVTQAPEQPAPERVVALD